jgi:hypothetical protein
LLIFNSIEHDQSRSEGSYGDPINIQVNDTNTSKHLCQFRALLVKKALFSKRNINFHIIQFLIPIFTIIASFYMTQNWKKASDLPELNLSIETYSPSVSFGKLNSNFARNAQFFKSFLKIYEEINNEMIFFENINEDMSDFFLQRSHKDLNRLYLFGMEINDENITGWFNNHLWHALPITLNTIHNRILRTMLGNASISLKNKPLPYNIDNKV